VSKHILQVLTIYAGGYIQAMPSPGTWRRVGIVRTDVLEKRVAAILRVEIIRGEVQGILSTLKMEAIRFSEKLVLIRLTS
jgi:hypothetical protein